MNNYDKVLDICKSDEDEIRVNFWTPFRINNFAYATNGFIICRIPLDLCETDIALPSDDKFRDSVSELHFEGKIYQLLDKAFVDKVLDWPMVEKNGLKTCTACDGDGEVVYTFRHGRKTFEHLTDCPVCDGEGEEEDETLPKGFFPDDSLFVKLGCHRFGYITLSILAEVVKLFPNSDIMTSLNIELYTTQIFKIDKIDFLVMPVYETEKMTKYFDYDN